MQMISEFAPAKINLSLHLVGQKSNGYHLLDSIVSFASVGDNISIAPGSSGELKVAGPFAKDLPTSSHNFYIKHRKSSIDIGLYIIFLCFTQKLLKFYT